MRYSRIMQCGAPFTSLVHGAVLQAEGRDIVHPLPLPLRGALEFCKSVVLCKDAERSSLFDRTEHFPPRTHRAHCAATAKREAQRSKFAAVHLCTLKQTTHSKKRAPYRTIPKHRTSAGASGGALFVISARICTHETLPPHQRGARSGEQPV